MKNLIIILAAALAIGASGCASKKADTCGTESCCATTKTATKTAAKPATSAKPAKKY